MVCRHPHVQQEFGDKSEHPHVISVLKGEVDAFLQLEKDRKEPFAVRVVHSLFCHHDIAKIRSVLMHQPDKRVMIFGVELPDDAPCLVERVHLVVRAKSFPVGTR